jgi:hypothetical protein
MPLLEVSNLRTYFYGDDEVETFRAGQRVRWAIDCFHDLSGLRPIRSEDQLARLCRDRRCPA